MAHTKTQGQGLTRIAIIITAVGLFALGVAMVAQYAISAASATPTTVQTPQGTSSKVIAEVDSSVGLTVDDNSNSLGVTVK